MNSSFLKTFSALMVCGCVVGCSAADNPKMPDVAPVKIEPNTTVPNTTGQEKQPYGASKKYQDLMKK
jgi:hypothetical protein